MKKKWFVFLLVSCGIHFLFWISLGTKNLDPLFNDCSHRIGKGGDFFQFYQAGSDLLAKRSIYETANKTLTIPYGSLYKYPPLLACTIGVASQLVSPWTGYKLWVVLTGCSFAVLILVLYRLFPAFLDSIPIICLCLVYTPYYVDLYMGQTNTIMAMLIVLLMRGFSTQRTCMAVIPFTLSINIKLNTIMFIPVYLANRWKSWLVGALGAAVLVFVPYFIWFPSDFMFFIKYAFGAPLDYFYQGGNVGSYPLLQDLVSLFSYDRHVITGLQMAWSAGIIATAIAVQIKSKNRDPLDLLSLWLCTFFLSFKFIWEHHLVMLLPVLALEFVRGDKKSIGFIWILLAIPTLFYFLDIDLGRGYTEIQPYWTDSQSIVYHSCKIVPIGFLFALVVARFFKRKVSFQRVMIIFAALIVAGGLVLVLKPVSARDYTALAYRAERKGNFERARACYLRALKKNPLYMDGVLAYSKFLYNRGEYKEFQNVLLDAIRLDPTNPFFKNLLNSERSSK